MPKSPNILLFCTDSHRGDVVGHAGDPAAVTPHMDTLAREGVAFPFSFCQNPVCVPSRCSFMSGLYPHVHGHRTMSHMLHPERGQSNVMPELKQQGYRVHWHGKNDLVPGQDGPDAHCHHYAKVDAALWEKWGESPQPFNRLHPARGEPGGDLYYSFLRGVIDTGGELLRDGDYAHVRGALEFLDAYTGAEPFLLVVTLAVPHPPYEVEKMFYDRIDPDKIPDRIRAEDCQGFDPAMRRELRKYQNLTLWPEERWTELRRIYYAMCARADHFLGLLLEKLRERGLYDDTAVLSFSDHGDFTGDYGLVEKTQNTFEDCLTRVPLQFKPPADLPLIPGVRSQLVELVDIAATVYDLAGVEPGYTHFGKSLLPLLRDPAAAHREAVFCEGGRLEHELHCRESHSNPDLVTTSEYWPRQRVQREDGRAHGKAVMCRTPDFKYVKRLYEPDQLYDLRRDPAEMVNLAEEEDATAILTAMRARMLDWMIATADVVPYEVDRRGLG